MRLHVIRLRVRKICEAPLAIYPAAGWDGFIPGRLGRVDESLPVAYELDGKLLAPLTLGQPIRIRRTARNGVICDGDFTSSPVQEIGTDWVRTENSVYLLRILP